MANTGGNIRHGRARRGSIAAAVLVAGAALAACGSSGPSGNGEASKSGAQVFSDAKKATSAASSLRISGSITESGSTTTVDLVLGHGAGSGTIGSSGEDFQVVLRSPSLYLKADAATWTKLSNATTAKLLADKWLKAPSTGSNFSSFADLLNIDKLTTSLTASGKLAAPTKTTFQGQSAVKVVDTGGKKGILYVAATGKPYILGISGTGANHGTIVFGSYDAATVAGAPAGAKTVTQLEKSAG